MTERLYYHDPFLHEFDATVLEATPAGIILDHTAFYPTSGGRYELTSQLVDKQGKPLANQAAEFLVHGSDLELADTGTNPANLKAIANLTGGVYVDADDAAKLADKMARKERRTARVERSEFWNSPGLFVFFLAAVTGEWLIRRRNHLV